MRTVAVAVLVITQPNCKRSAACSAISVMSVRKSSHRTLRNAFSFWTIIVTAGCGGGRESGNPITASPTSSRPPVQLKVMTFNIQHGIDGQDKYNLQRAIDTIARIRPDIVGLQEVTRNHPSYNCDDQPARLAAG